jgi:hypothetical protein
LFNKNIAIYFGALFPFETKLNICILWLFEPLYMYMVWNRLIEMLTCFLWVCILDFKVGSMATCHLQLEFILYKILVSSCGLSHYKTLVQLMFIFESSCYKYNHHIGVDAQSSGSLLWWNNVFFPWVPFIQMHMVINIF